MATKKLVKGTDKTATKQAAEAPKPAPTPAPKPEAAAKAAAKTPKKAAATAEAKAAKKAAKKAAEAPKVAGIAGPVRQGAELYLHPTDLAKLEAAQLRTKGAEQAVELATAKIRAFMLEAQAQIKASQDDARKLASEYETQRVALLELYSRLGSAYGIDMQAVAYDPTTGRINRLPA